MSNAITVGKRLIPREQIAFIEPFDPTANPDFQAGRPYRGRLVMTNPDESVLTEDSPKAFADAHGFRLLQLDGIATNPDVRFRVESFMAGEGFKPTKPYATRLLWREDGKDHSKLLLSQPETVLAVAVRGMSDALAAPAQEPVNRPSRRKPMMAASGSEPKQ